MMVSNSPAGEKKWSGSGLSGLWCWIALAGIIIGAGAIRGRLASMPLERDEGEYAYIAQQMLDGVPPYESAYSMKLPGIYAVYAGVLTIFGQTDTAIRTGLIVFNAGTIFVVFLLGRRMFGSVAGVAAGCAYAAMSLARPVLGLSANAEHFVVLPALAGVLLIHQVAEARKYGSLCAAGLLMGLAFIIKQHGILFGMFGAVYLLYVDLRNRPIVWKKLIASQVVFSVGVIVPFVITCLLFWQAGVFGKFWFWTFTYANEYASMVPLSVAAYLFVHQFSSVAGAMILIWLTALASLVLVIFFNRYRQGTVFVLGFLLFSFLAICPGFYFRGHYFIFLLPVVAILAGAGYVAISDLLIGRSGAFYRGLVAVAVGVIIVGISLYQQRIFLFDNTPEKVCRMIYGGNPFPESPKIAEFIRANSDVNDMVAVIGSEPQIYFYSGRRAATHYIYMYPLMEVHDYAAAMQKEMIDEIEANKPEIMVVVRVQTSWLDRAGSVRDIFKWVDTYGPKYYDLAGIVDILSADETVYRWNQQAVGYTPKSDYQVAVYKRKH